MIRKIFSSPVKATFVMSFLTMSAIGFSVDYWGIYKEGRSTFSIFRWSLTTSMGLSMALFTPLLVSALTSLLVVAWKKSKISLENYNPLKITSRIGFVLLYLGSTFFGFMGIVYIA